MIPSYRREVKSVEFPSSACKCASNEESERDGAGDIYAHELGHRRNLDEQPELLSAALRSL